MSSRLEALKEFVIQFCLSVGCSYTLSGTAFWAVAPISNEEAELFATGLEVLGWEITKGGSFDSEIGLSMQTIPFGYYSEGITGYFLNLRHSCWEDQP